MVMRQILFIISLLNLLISQIEHEHIHEHEHEFSIAIGLVPGHLDEETNVGLHAHYIKGIGNNNDFGIGLSLETILDDHSHNSISLIGSYHFDNGFSVAYAPGIIISDSNEDSNDRFTQHFEFCYEFEFNQFHLGPQFDLGIDNDEIHYMFGIHLGLDF